MGRNPKILRGAGLVAALIGAAALGMAVGSAGAPTGDWACPPERVGIDLITLLEGGGSATAEDALVEYADLLAEDGTYSRDEYVAAITSRTGSDRFDPETGELFLDDQLQAVIVTEQLTDGTWAVGRVESCRRPPTPEEESPYPTPATDELGS